VECIPIRFVLHLNFLTCDIAFCFRSINNAEVRIAQNLVTEFGHFKEVLTMVWNEETIQKPPEDTVRDIRGHCLDQQTMNESPLGINSDGLLEQFFEFESLYTSFLGEYLSPGADLNALVKKTVDLAETLTPISCDHGFGNKTKEHLPTIMAGIFALFTVLKSGESFNRLEEVPSGDSIDSTKLLMKPHNIQVMTLLCMFGCGSSGSSSLQSQLMQIRTGEGKSMILGAAAVIFGLLGFQVRCICYSEYLSNRDYELFHDVFRYFGLLGSINYSKITTLSEETTAAKGNIRGLTLSLMHGNLRCNSGDNQPSSQVADSASSRGALKDKKNKGTAEEIMLVDEVDVFFGSEFYGREYLCACACVCVRECIRGRIIFCGLVETHIFLIIAPLFINRNIQSSCSIKGTGSCNNPTTNLGSAQARREKAAFS
jgi:hypothetical protein